MAMSFAWNKLVWEHTRGGQGREALRLYQKMREEGIIPDHHTFVAALKACPNLADIEAIHTHIDASGQMNTFVSTTLVDRYAKCGSIEAARQVFEHMRHRNVISWNAMIVGYAQMEMGHLALELFDRMQHESYTPNARTFVAALKACASLAAQARVRGPHDNLLKTKYLEQGRAIHAEVAKRGLESDIFISNTLVDMYSKCGSIKDAFHVFERMKHKDVVSWTAMITGYAQMEMGDVALELYACMQCKHFRPDARTFAAALKACASLAVQAEGADGDLLKVNCLEKGRTIHAEVTKRGFESDTFISNILIDMYAKCGSLKDAHQVFENLRLKDIVSWNTLIRGYAQMEMGNLALQLYAHMKDEGFTPDVSTFLAALKACGSMALLETGKELHSEIHKVGLLVEPSVANCLIEMYSRCGNMWNAQQLFDSLLLRDSVTWGALIAGYSDQGNSDCVFDLYKTMQVEGIEPDDITFVAILNVCRHNGLVEKGQMYFQEMCLEHGIFPSYNHYICMIDLLGRIGFLDEAAAMVIKMPFESDNLTWITILGACRKWNIVETGRNAFECALMLDVNSDAAIYVSSWMLKDISRIEELRLKSQETGTMQVGS